MEDELSEQLHQLTDLSSAGGLRVRQSLQEKSGELLPGRHEERAGGPDVHQGGVATHQSDNSDVTCGRTQTDMLRTIPAVEEKRIKGNSLSF